MGIPRGTARLLLDEARERPFSGRLLELGRMAVYATRGELERWAREQRTPLAEVRRPGALAPAGARGGGLPRRPELLPPARLRSGREQRRLRLGGRRPHPGSQSAGAGGRCAAASPRCSRPARSSTCSTCRRSSPTCMPWSRRAVESSTAWRRRRTMSTTASTCSRRPCSTISIPRTAGGSRPATSSSSSPSGSAAASTRRRGRSAATPRAASMHLAYGGFGARQVALFVVATKVPGATADRIPQQSYFARFHAAAREKIGDSHQFGRRGWKRRSRKIGDCPQFPSPEDEGVEATAEAPPATPAAAGGEALLAG